MTFRKVTSLCSRKYKNKSNYSALPLTIKIYSFFILCERIKAVKSLFNDDSGIYEQTVLQMKFHLHFVWGNVISYLGIDDIAQEVQEYHIYIYIYIFRRHCQNYILKQILIFSLTIYIKICNLPYKDFFIRQMLVFQQYEILIRDVSKCVVRVQIDMRFV